MNQRGNPRKGGQSKSTGKGPQRNSSGRQPTRQSTTRQPSRQPPRSERPEESVHRGGDQGRDRDSGLGGEQIEGRRAVYELLAAKRRRVREVYMAQGLDESDLVQEILDLCIEQRVAVRQVGRTRIDQIAKSDAPQGIVAMAAALPEYELDELCESRPGRVPFLLAFDGVTDPHNLGSLIRTGECAGVTGVLLPRHRAVHVTPTVAKASAGAVEHVPMTVVAGLPSALRDCKQAGVWTVGLDPDGDTDIDDLAVADQPIVLVFGAEGAGLSRLTKDRCDVLARIPQHGSVASLNVAAAGAVACFAVARRRAASQD